MTKTKILKTTLLIGAFFNFVAATMVAFPTSLGKIIELPEPGTIFYSGLVSMIVFIFGFAYGWMALQKKINRPMLTLAGTGKIGVFSVALFCYQTGALSFPAFSVAIGDLIFGAIFFWWLMTEKEEG